MTAPAKESAKFVFKGTVKRTKAANLKAITDTDKTVVVKVDEVVRAPQALAGFVGRDVTVELAKGERVKEGQALVFYTNGWVFGENVAVRSLGHDPIKAPPKAAAAKAVARAAPPDPARAAAHQRILERVEEAPVVISGKVVAVGLPGAPAGAVTAAAAHPTRRRPISEHDPLWREAVVEVHQVHKGTAGEKQVVVRFPGSTDVRWYHAPKFQVGQEGVFALQPDSVSGHPTFGAAAASFSPAESFTCLNAADFQPADHKPETEAAISAATKSDEKS